MDSRYDCIRRQADVTRALWRDERRSPEVRFWGAPFCVRAQCDARAWERCRWRYCRSRFPMFGRKALRGHAGNITVHRFLTAGAKPYAGMWTILPFTLPCVLAQNHARLYPQLHNRIYIAHSSSSVSVRNLRAQICLFTLNMRIMRPYFPNMCLKRTNGRAIIWPYYASLRRLV